ncbi:hypothetical protein [Peribacillus asahii]|uniref:hypothetical protein n=1 Tax=Peribacillus asahii TaxID=228899 RepID=UPI00382AF814
MGLTSAILEQSNDGGNTWNPSHIYYSPYGDLDKVDANDQAGLQADPYVTVDQLTSGNTYIFRLVVTGGSKAGTSNQATITF